MQIASSAGHGGTGLSIIPIHGKQRQEEHEFRAILHCMPRPYLKPNKKASHKENSFSSSVVHTIQLPGPFKHSWYYISLSTHPAMES